MALTKGHLVDLILKSKRINVVVADSLPGDGRDSIYEGPLNDIVLREDGTLELWYNTGYEI
jgi:hypothetical protein